MGRLAHHLILLEDQLGFEISVEESVAEATSEETFDVIEFVKGANTPETKVSIYTDADAAMKILEFLADEDAEKVNVDEYSLGDALPDEDKLQLSEEELTALHERLLASELIFTLKGLAPAALKALENHLKATTDYTENGDTPEYDKALDSHLVAKSIVGVQRRNGAKSTTKWTPEKVEALMEELYASEKNKLFVGVGSINYVGAVFDQAVSADFS